MCHNSNSGNGALSSKMSQFASHAIILLKSVCLSVFANCRSQFLLDRLGKCLQLFVSSDSIILHEFASQFGLAFFLYAKNIQNYSEYCVAHARGQLNRTSVAGNCGHDSSPPTSRNGNELSGNNILWSRLIASGESERRQHERRQRECL